MTKKLLLHKIIKWLEKVRNQDNKLSERLPSANKNLVELLFSMMNTKLKSIEGKIFKLQNLKGETTLKLHQVFTNFCDELDFQRQCGDFHFEEDPFTKSAQGITMIRHEALFLMKCFQRKPQIKSQNINYYELY